MKTILRSLQQFGADERGTVTNVMLPMFLLLILTTGWAIDLIMHETERADLQNALDRGVLAATSVSQSLDAEALINEYVQKRPLAKPEHNLAVNVNANTQGVGARSIRATAGFDFPTIFANIVYHPSYPVPAIASAQEGVEHVEISLVLDISASMAQDNAKDTTDRRLAVLRAAAKDFVSDMLTSPGRQKFSISLIPYSGSVNAGDFFSELSNGRVHGDSSCIEFEDNDFTFAGLPPSASRGQVPQFNFFRYTGAYEANGVNIAAADENVWGWCPRDSRAIVPFSKDVNLLNDAIDNFQGHDGTGTQIGMKWGLALLDPTTQPIIQSFAINENHPVPLEFANRPAAYGTGGVTKVIVLMTDGNIRYQARPNAEQLSDPDLRDYWASPVGAISPFSGNASVQNTMSRTSNRQFLAEPNLTTLSDVDEPLRTNQFLGLCDIARNNDIRVFTIGFDISEASDANSEMNYCASTQEELDLQVTAANYFFVEGTGLRP